MSRIPKFDQNMTPPKKGKTKIRHRYINHLIIVDLKMDSTQQTIHVGDLQTSGFDNQADVMRILMFLGVAEHSGL